MLDVAARANDQVLRYLRRRKPGTEAYTSPNAHADPYMTLGSHPDTVEWLWQKVGAGLPVNGRAVVYGAPALVHPETGIVLGFTLGTAYVIRVGDDLRDEAEAAGCASSRTWGDDSTTDLAAEIDRSWLFGTWDKRERDWVRHSYDEFSRPSA